ncbi:tubulin domain-containing protein [Podospora australis]|uniref:Tubulin domain-containing protein n=1 Tax=Podospora australis TaxID=1536484 RepID=A0AAN6X1Q5_9PEZI|nr:tubulin domain-containing protein [Podospora australis]
MHEIITIQLGQQSNYLGTHFWNTQESYFSYNEDETPVIDHDVHFRPGIAPDGTETFMPRTLIYDLKGAFGSLKKINALYDLEDEGEVDEKRAAALSLWQGKTTIQRQPPLAPSPYTSALENGILEPGRPKKEEIRFFSDYSRVYYHPRSIVQMNEYDIAGTVPFEKFETGEELFRDLDREHDLLDRDLRPFVEEADSMQGFQVFTGLDDAWGGFAARYLERVRDEYGKGAVWVWGLEQTKRGLTRDKRLQKLANKARALTELYKQATIVVPLAVPERLPRGVQLDYNSAWHTTGLLAVAVESALLPTRLKDRSQRETLSSMAATLNTMGKQNVAGLQMRVVGPEEKEAKKISDEDVSEGVKLDISFSPTDQLDSYGRSNGSQRPPRVFSQLVLSRKPQRDVEEEGWEWEVDDKGERRRTSSYEPVTKGYNSTLQFPILDSFPDIFRSEDGEPLTQAVNITSSLSTDSSVCNRLKNLRTTVIRSIGLEDRETLGNELMEMADEYHEGWSSGSDEGEDD